MSLSSSGSEYEPAPKSSRPTLGVPVPSKSTSRKSDPPDPWTPDPFAGESRRNGGGVSGPGDAVPTLAAKLPGGNVTDDLGDSNPPPRGAAFDAACADRDVFKRSPFASDP